MAKQPDDKTGTDGQCEEVWRVKLIPWSFMTQGNSAGLSHQYLPFTAAASQWAHIVI